MANVLCQGIKWCMGRASKRKKIIVTGTARRFGQLEYGSEAWEGNKAQAAALMLSGCSK